MSKCESRRTISVEVTEEEEKDLEEYLKHHPERAKNPGEALKQMAGLKTYRVLKQKLDPDRKKASVELLPQDIGMPSTVPCAFNEQLDAFGMSYDDFVAKAVELVVKLAEKALDGDEDAVAFFEKAKGERLADIVSPLSLEGLEFNARIKRMEGETPR